jgi:hypothetical protein
MTLVAGITTDESVGDEKLRFAMPRTLDFAVDAGGSVVLVVEARARDRRPYPILDPAGWFATPIGKGSY